MKFRQISKKVEFRALTQPCRFEETQRIEAMRLTSKIAALDKLTSLPLLAPCEDPPLLSIEIIHNLLARDSIRDRAYEP